VNSVPRLAGLTALALVLAASPGASRPVLLLENQHLPHARISWPQEDGKTASFEADREYQAPKQATPIGANLTAYVALGGTRGDIGQGEAGAVDVRIGFYKADNKKPLFEKLAKYSAITVVLSGVRFNQPATPRLNRVLQHLKFTNRNSVLGCADDPGLFATFNTYDPADNLRGRMTRRNGRPGALSTTKGASVAFATDKDGGITMTAVIPYALFKHADDPWKRANPGDFTEPVHFHIEFDVVATSAGQPKAKPDPPT
jgi:hypothetical protein